MWHRKGNTFLGLTKCDLKLDANDTKKDTFLGHTKCDLKLDANDVKKETLS